MGKDDNESIIGKYSFDEYDLPYKNGILTFGTYDGGNCNSELNSTRHYLRIYGILCNSYKLLGYLYFSVYEDNGVKISSFIGEKVFDEYKGKGIADLLMATYLEFSNDIGCLVINSVTRQRKLDVLTHMNKFDFSLINPEVYEFGECSKIKNNKMVVIAYKSFVDGMFYYQFNSPKAEKVYRNNNYKICGSYSFIDCLDMPPESFKKICWFVPGEEYTISDKDVVLDKSVKILVKSNYSR